MKRVSLPILSLFLAGIFFFLPVLLPLSLFAQFNQSGGIAETFTLLDETVNDGDIVSLTDKENQLMLSKKAYDEKMYGVIDQSSLLILRRPGHATPISRSGTISVNVTTLNGLISIGDYITSSPLPGKGQKATDVSGFLLGVALSSFSGSDGKTIEFEGKTITSGTVQVSVGIGPASPLAMKTPGSFFGTLGQIGIGFLTSIRTTQESERLFRMILASVVAITTLFVNFSTFGKNVTKGIESIGRNPLSKVAIQSMIIVNIMLIALVSIGGILLSLAILNL